MKAAATRGITIIAEGEEAAALANLPIPSLRLHEEPRRSLRCGAFARWANWRHCLKSELIARLGPEARRWRELARGAHPHMFQPIEPEFTLREFCEFETPVEEIDSLLFMGARMIDCLVARAADRALSLALLTARMQLEGGKSHQCVLRPAVPSTDRKFLLKLLQLEVGAHPPQAAVVSLELTAEAGRCGTVQLGLFAPQTPEPSRLDVTLARLRAIVGDDRVGSPVLEDTHRPGSFRMEGFASETPRAKTRTGRAAHGFAAGASADAVRVCSAKPGLRSFAIARIALQSRPHTGRGKPAAAGGRKTTGIWKSGMCWPSATTDRSVACLLVCDRTRNEWRLEAFYD